MASIGHKRNNHYKEKNRPTQPSLGYVSEYMQQVGIVVSRSEERNRVIRIRTKYLKHEQINMQFCDKVRGVEVSKDITP
jgi:hypothetical protein